MYKTSNYQQQSIRHILNKNMIKWCCNLHISLKNMSKLQKELKIYFAIN